MDDGLAWLDELSRKTYEWVRIGPYRIETELRPGLPCKVMAGEADGQPVLYMAIGTNGTIHYWQTSTMDRETRRPLPKEEAFSRLLTIMELAAFVSMSKIRPALVDLSKEKA